MPNLQMWGRALTHMPKLSAQQWQALDPLARWLLACRASVLFMTLAAAALGGLLAWRDGRFDTLPWLLCTLGLLLAHATNNLLNDYSDSRRGIDRDNDYRKQYGVHILEDGLVSQAGFWRYLAPTGLLALALGLWLVALRGEVTLHLMLAGAFFVLFYTWPLKYYGLGEPAVLLVWGPLMVGGSYYIASGQWSWPVTTLSMVFALGPTAVLFGKHIDKMPADRAKGVNTLPVLLGDGLARACTRALLLCQYLLCLALVWQDEFGWPLLLVLACLPRLLALWPRFGAPKPDQRPANYPHEAWPLWFSAWAFRHTRLFSSLFLAGVMIDTALQRWP
ncbi:prenyltransferase [Parahaliea mediterranea]|uniref:prenyltransferase n=1 Tax=Parahaliea mediterranea TaxID=651086 RepID=UPI0014739C01|nr:prenyltransferase [Parahaliea mediterranea]